MLRIFIALGVLIFILVIILQNLQSVRLNFLIWSFESSMALIIIVTFILTIILSIIIALPLKILNIIRKNKKNEKTEANKPNLEKPTS